MKYGERLAQTALNRLVKKIAKKAKIEKRYNPHWFSHSGLTWISTQGFNERDLRIRAGWTDDSSMSSVYCHYHEDEVNDKYAVIQGVEIKEKEIDETLKPILCPRYEKLNPTDSKY